jgi:hypothetical protein
MKESGPRKKKYLSTRKTGPFEGPFFVDNKKWPDVTGRIDPKTGLLQG